MDGKDCSSEKRTTLLIKLSLRILYKGRSKTLHGCKQYKQI